MASGVFERSGSPIPDSEYEFTWSDFDWIATFVRAQAGIVLNESKVNLVYSRLAKRLRAVGLRTFRDYCKLVGSDAGLSEQQAMIAAITTNVTRFFREPHHFEHLKRAVLPALSERARAGERVRIWSAGCSTGEEPYSIAMTMLEAMPDAGERDVLVLATDIDHIVLAKAKEGVYSPAQVEGIPPELRGQALSRERVTGDFVYRVREPVKRIVRFRELNLLDDWPMKARFDAVFCRNVMIYFDEPTQRAAWRRFAEMLQPQGHLYIGHSERISTEGTAFDLVAQTTYRLKGRAKP